MKTNDASPRRLGATGHARLGTRTRSILIGLGLTVALPATAQQKDCKPIDLPRSDFTGKGTQLTWDCARFEGDFVKGRLRSGSVRFRDGEIKEGTFNEYLDLTGPGRHTLPDGTVREGVFVRGSLNGEGKVTFPDGRVFQGPTRYGRPDGRGKMTHKDGAIEEGAFANDGSPFGFVLRTNPDGSRIVGEYRVGKPFGRFVLARPDGTGEVTHYAWGGTLLDGPAGTPPTAQAASKSAEPASQPATPQTPPAKSAAQPAESAGAAAGQVADEVGRAIRGLRGIFGR